MHYNTFKGKGSCDVIVLFNSLDEFLSRIYIHQTVQKLLKSHVTVCKSPVHVSVNMLKNYSNWEDTEQKFYVA